MKNRIHGDSEEPERQQQKPDDGIEDEGKQGQRPADNKKKQPEKKCRHEFFYEHGGRGFRCT